MSGKKDKDSSSAGQGTSESKPSVAVRDTTPQEKPHRASFPGPRGAQSPLRVAIDRSAHAELISHAKSSLDAEICGVLAGRICEDDEGLFVHVQAVIRGTSASEKSTRVTFTQATWTHIHESLERDHPNLKIVGWYHSHPGFGVEFSEMDLFIQRNFFSSPTQIALVTDPVNGAVAICINTEKGIQYLPRFWVDGREQECKSPAATGSALSTSPDAGSGKIADLETKVNQLTLAIDDLRTSLYRFLLFAGILFCVAVVALAVYGIQLQFKARVEPPKNIGFAQVPVQIGDHTALLGVNVTSWKLPPELDAVVQATATQIREQFLKQLAAQGITNAAEFLTNLPAPATAPQP